ncbi:SusC/RagA family TonB-linked outer membrane protein [uncultured Lutibacter sp.]|uniref:SusC/RagA family TonB-linked outer membrane protein n=1 Tax=uncultured Lutibacter sp. TaxID=437739 RepID=UPI0026239F1A|nr:SusC/RagA family TonB-linked outer membrane protein [uncultured Lutibacter sp.]
MYSQERKITGTVVSEESGPLPGVNVVVKNTSRGVLTDFDGKYSIIANTGDVLVFSFVGMKSVEKKVGNSNTVNITMKEDAEMLKEVVVTALGIKRVKGSIGSATTIVDSEELNEGSQSNIADAIKGKVAGVVISSSSTDPGASSGVIIRGFSTLGGSNQPLYIVDGVPVNNASTFSNSLNGAYDFGRGSGEINPEDIESISILKGASSTALYGSRAANGVVLITTKRGTKSKLSINFSTSAMFSDVLRMPKYQDQFGQGWDGQHFLIENGSWGPRFTDEPMVWGNVVNNSQKVKPYSFQKDQLRNFFDVGTNYVNNVSISGGSDTTTGRISYNNTTADGIYPTKADSNERNTLSLSFNSKMDFLTFGGNLNYVNVRGSSVAAGQGTTVFNNLMQIPNDFDITEFKDYKNDPFNNVSNYYTPYGITNPYFSLNENGAKFLKERVYGSFNINAELNEWMNISYRLGLDQSSDKTRIWNAIIDAAPGSPNDGSSTEQPGSYAEGDNFAKQINHDFMVDLNLDVSEKLKIQSSFGANYNERRATTLNASVSSQDIPDFYSLSNSSNPATTSSTINKRRLFGVLNSTTFSYNDMLYLTTNVRNDWYSTLPKENRSVLYGGANASWVLTNTFPEIKDVVNYAKLRLGYGETGVDTGAYQILPVFVLGTTNNQGFRSLQFPVGGINAWEVGNRAANPNLEPERRKEFEIGTELSFLKNRISLDLSYYNATVENQILALPLAASSGYTTQTANIGTISNKGIEALLKLGIFRNSEGFSWNTSINFSTNDAILKKLDNRVKQLILSGTSATTLIAREGEPLALIEGSVPLRDPNGNIVVDNNGIPIASPVKEVYGDTQYDYTIGITNQFSYKNFSLGFTIDSRQGGLMYSRTASITRFTGNSITTTFNDRAPYIIPGSVQQVSPNNFVENTTPIDYAHWDNYYAAAATSRDDVIDKSFIKLREVIFSYNFNNKILKNTPIKDLSLTIVGRNLLVFTPEQNQYIDPEVSTFGTDLASQFGEFSANPTTRSVGLTLKAKF